MEISGTPLPLLSLRHQASQSTLEPRSRGIIAERVLQKGALLGGTQWPGQKEGEPMPEAKNSHLERQRKLAGWPAS